VRDWLADLRPTTRVAESVLDGLDLEVRRTGREHRTTTRPKEETG